MMWDHKNMFGNKNGQNNKKLNIFLSEKIFKGF